MVRRVAGTRKRGVGLTGCVRTEHVPCFSNYEVSRVAHDSVIIHHDQWFMLVLFIVTQDHLTRNLSTLKFR
jgi:hypothetical protein